MEDCTKMRRCFLELVKLLIPYDVATFYLSNDGLEHLLGHPVGINVGGEALQEYTDEFEEIDYTRWVFISAKGMAYRETDLFPDPVREETALYKKMYAPNNLHYSAQLSLVSGDVFLGIISLYRSKTGEDFSEKDLFVLDMVKDHLALRLFRESNVGSSVAPMGKNLSFPAYAEQFKLTQRESEVFYLLFDELTDEQICGQLFIGFNTLKKHILSIYKKAGRQKQTSAFQISEQKFY
jgi:DNA-binding CsgD family transcriptional regulator